MNLSIQEILTQAAGFLLLVAVLKRLFWKPLLDNLESRRDKIRGDLDHAAQVRQEVDKLKADYEAHLQNIEKEARQHLQETVEEGRRIAREIQAKARADAQAAFEKTRESLEIEAAKARLELKRDIAHLALEVSEQILKEKMADDKKQEDKIMALLEELEKKP